MNWRNDCSSREGRRRGGEGEGGEAVLAGLVGKPTRSLAPYHRLLLGYTYFICQLQREKERERESEREAQQLSLALARYYPIRM